MLQAILLTFREEVLLNEAEEENPGQIGRLRVQGVHEETEGAMEDWCVADVSMSVCLRCCSAPCLTRAAPCHLI